MIYTRKNDQGEVAFVDNSQACISEYGHSVYACVIAALEAGLESFTTPTRFDDEGRIDWVVKKWVFTKNHQPVIHLVACKQNNEHFEILGPRWKGIIETR